MSIMTIITVTIIANNFTIIYSPCSVPYRGYSFFNLLQIAELKAGVDGEFPSLTGVIRFLMNAWKQVEDMRKMKFPSLTGVIHFLIHV